MRPRARLALRPDAETSNGKEVRVLEDNPFIGMGNNPDGPELPVGLSMKLAQEPQAVAQYGTLSQAEQASVIRYNQNGSTGEAAESRIDEVVQCLKDNQLGRILPARGGA